MQSKDKQRHEPLGASEEEEARTQEKKRRLCHRRQEVRWGGRTRNCAHGFQTMKPHKDLRRECLPPDPSNPTWDGCAGGAMVGGGGD